jgi:hypothetical protein
MRFGLCTAVHMGPDPEVFAAHELDARGLGRARLFGEKVVPGSSYIMYLRTEFQYFSWLSSFPCQCCRFIPLCE